MRRKLANSAEYKRRFDLGAYVEKWAVTMAKVGIRQAVARAPWPRWNLVTFCGSKGGESRGVVDMIAIRKDHSQPPRGLKRGDPLQIILIQIKGGGAAKPTAQDAERLRKVARLHHAYRALLATWKHGRSARFFSLGPRRRMPAVDWKEITDPAQMFRYPK